MLLEHAHITLEHADAVQDALTEFRSRPSLGFSDCLMVGVARKAGHVPLGTFDRDLARLDGTQRV
jgi:predicted nucleic acid-binding protein